MQRMFLGMPQVIWSSDLPDVGSYRLFDDTGAPAAMADILRPAAPYHGVPDVLSCEVRLPGNAGHSRAAINPSFSTVARNLCRE